MISTYLAAIKFTPAEEATIAHYMASYHRRWLATLEAIRRTPPGIVPPHKMAVPSDMEDSLRRSLAASTPAERDHWFAEVDGWNSSINAR
jgi:hypothetical protein